MLVQAQPNEEKSTVVNKLDFQNLASFLKEAFNVLSRMIHKYPDFYYYNNLGSEFKIDSTTPNVLYILSNFSRKFNYC